MSIPTVFLDKDGTLIQDIAFNVDPRKIRLMPKAREGIEQLAREGYAFVVVSNQPGVSQGKFTLKDLDGVARKLDMLMQAMGAKFLGAYFCPHDDADHCNCRKPACGLIEQALGDHDIDINSSWMIGDILDDVEAGNRAGLHTVLLDNGHEDQWQEGLFRVPDAVARNLDQAATLISLYEDGYV